MIGRLTEKWQSIAKCTVGAKWDGVFWWQLCTYPFVFRLEDNPELPLTKLFPLLVIVHRLRVVWEIKACNLVACD